MTGTDSTSSATPSQRRSSNSALRIAFDPALAECAARLNHELGRALHAAGAEAARMLADMMRGRYRG